MLSRLVNSYRHTGGTWYLNFQNPSSVSSNSWIGDRDDGGTAGFRDGFKRFKGRLVGPFSALQPKAYYCTLTPK